MSMDRTIDYTFNFVASHTSAIVVPSTKPVTQLLIINF